MAKMNYNWDSMDDYIHTNHQQTIIYKGYCNSCRTIVTKHSGKCIQCSEINKNRSRTVKEIITSPREEDKLASSTWSSNLFIEYKSGKWLFQSPWNQSSEEIEILITLNSFIITNGSDYENNITWLIYDK